MSTLTILYLCLLVPCVLYLLVTLFSGGDCDIDSSIDGGSIHNLHGLYFCISSICYFMIGFSAAGLLFEKFGVFVSVVAGLVTGTICFFVLKSMFKWFTSVCSINEVEIPQPKIGDRCVALNNISLDDVGMVKIFKEIGNETKILTYFAISNGSQIMVGASCIVTQIDGDSVIVEPLPENEYLSR